MDSEEFDDVLGDEEEPEGTEEEEEW